MKKKILIADDVDTGALSKFPKTGYELSYKPGISTEDILLMHCDALVIRSTRRISKEFAGAFTGDVIATFTKGTDHIDADACRENGIKILSAEEGNSQAAAEHTLAMMLAAVKDLLHSDKLVREERFSDTHFERTELNNKKVGIIGYGSIGKRVVKLCEAFGMSVYVSEIDHLVRKRNKKISFKSLNYILKNCDIISVHIPLGNNVNFLSKEKLSILKRHSILINTSRGGIVDEDFLINLLKEKRIRFACIDVFNNEPNVNPLFFNLNNVILSNHTAGKTVESKIRIADEVAKKLYRFLEKRK